MSDGLSRRELVAMFGAGMAVSACAAQDDNAAENGANQHESLARASCDNLGENPHKAPRPEFKANPPEFKPKYIAILCIELGNDWTMAVNHANFQLGEDELDPELREKKALKALNESWPKESKARNHFRLNKDNKPRLRSDGVTVDDHTDFNKFRFHREIELYIYLYHSSDNKTIAPEGRLLSFGSYMQETDSRKVPLKAVGNCAYFNAKLVDLNNHEKLNKHGFMFKVENWSRKPDGTPVGAEEVRHSMNIHFSIPVNTGNKIIMMPMVFDPDTGNGTGNEP